MVDREIDRRAKIRGLYRHCRPGFVASLDSSRESPRIAEERRFDPSSA